MSCVVPWNQAYPGASPARYRISQNATKAIIEVSVTNHDNSYPSHLINFVFSGYGSGLPCVQQYRANPETSFPISNNSFCLNYITIKHVDKCVFVLSCYHLN